MAKIEDKKAIDYWERYVRDLERATVVDFSESQEDKLKRIAYLEANDEEWFKYYFPNYYTDEPAPFQKESTKRVMSNPEFYEVRAWSRELAKSALTMMAFIKLALTKKKRFFIITSASETAATKHLKPYKLNFESNQRIINDYGKQQKYGDWTDNAFNTTIGATFVALGAGQSPRGLRNEEVRPDAISVDDFDTDEICRNPDRVEQNWNWLEQALFATRSISKPLLIVFNGNIIADDCTIKRAIERAKKIKTLAYAQIVNIRDKDGKSTWAKNTEEMIDRVLELISWDSGQKEYYNTPITAGKVFKEINYIQMRPLREYKFLIAYTDPSYKKKGDFKATILIGRWKNEYHILKVFCQQTTVAKMLDWNYEIYKFVAGKVPVFFYIEWPWIDDTIKAEIVAANVRHGVSIHPKADERTKPDKYYRIEAALEPLNRKKELLFSEAEKGTKDMEAMAGQFLALSPTSRAHDDGPDAVEGGKWVLDSKTSADPGKISSQKFSRNETTKHF